MMATLQNDVAQQCDLRVLFVQQKGASVTASLLCSAITFYNLVAGMRRTCTGSKLYEGLTVDALACVQAKFFNVSNVFGVMETSRKQSCK